MWYQGDLETDASGNATAYHWPVVQLARGSVKAGCSGNVTPFNASTRWHPVLNTRISQMTGTCGW